MIKRTNQQSQKEKLKFCADSKVKRHSNISRDGRSSVTFHVTTRHVAFRMLKE